MVLAPRSVARRWSVHAVDAERRDRLVAAHACSAVLADLLVSRGVDDVEHATRFLDPKLLDLADPDGLPDIALAVGRVEDALLREEKIAIYGDYDVDGIASTCLLLEFFSLIDQHVEFRLPHRIRDGYGLRPPAVEALAADGVTLLITVDNGSSSVDAIARAAELGMDVVVVDHHQPSEIPPRPVALVNPWLANGTDLPFRDLAGVGVVFKFVWALARRLSKSRKLSPRFRAFLLDALALVALGTVCDVVPLRGENRVFVKFGLDALMRSPRPGLQELVRLALRNEDSTTRLAASHIAFRIGPRLNAVGRLDDATVAVELLRTDDEEKATRLVREIDALNDRRRAIEAEITEAARALVPVEHDLATDRVIVLGDAGWHPGVIGIVASRLAEEFWRPVFLFSERDGRWRGSARSVPGVHLVDALRQASEHVIQYGGHALAAGAEIAEGCLPDLRRALNRAIELRPERMVPEILVDAPLALEVMSAGFLRELDQLGPHGEGNPEPIFTADVEVIGTPRLLGASGDHLSFWVRERKGGCAFRAIAFRMGDRFAEIRRSGTRVSILFQPEWNCWQGKREIQLRVHDLRVDEPASGVGSSP